MLAATWQMQYSPPSNRGMAIGHVCFAAFFDKALEMQVKDFFNQIATSLRLLVTLRPYRLAARQQREDEANFPEQTAFRPQVRRPFMRATKRSSPP